MQKHKIYSGLTQNDERTNRKGRIRAASRQIRTQRNKSFTDVLRKSYLY